MSFIQYHDSVRNNFVADINTNLNQSIKNKAMLSLKYESLNFRISIVQIGIILLSTGLTVMNSIKSYYELKSPAIDVISIVFTAMIGLIMAIYRFLKMDDRKEAICNITGNYTGIINKFNRLVHRMDKFVIMESNIDEWNQIISNYQEEVLDTYLGIRENFENIFNYKDAIYYKNEFKKLYLENELINNEIDTITHCKKTSIPKHIGNEESGPFNRCSKKTDNNINYQHFISTNESDYLEHANKVLNNKLSNQDLYNKYILPLKSETETTQNTVINNLQSADVYDTEEPLPLDNQINIKVEEAELPVNNNSDSDSLENGNTEEGNEDIKKRRMHQV